MNFWGIHICIDEIRIGMLVITTTPVFVWWELLKLQTQKAFYKLVYRKA